MLKQRVGAWHSTAQRSGGQQCPPTLPLAFTRSCTPPHPAPQVREWIGGIGVENMGKRLVNSKEGKVEFDKPAMPLATLMHYGECEQTALVGRRWLVGTGLRAARL